VTTLAEIKHKLGSDNFAWNGGPMDDGSIAMKNSYRMDTKGVIVTLVTQLSKEERQNISKKIDRTQIDRVFTLVAVILGDSEYLESIWGTEHLPKPEARKVALSLLQPSEQARDRSSEQGSTRAEIKLAEDNGTFLVPVQINGRLVLDFTIDSGAADVQIPGDVLLTLTRTGTISKSDFLGTQTYLLADGSAVPSPRFMLHTVEIGGHAVHDVAASVGTMSSPPLLGQSFLSKLGSWTLDNERHVLVLSDKR
jgi:clan AA aspartic protease (TIGR02281 family)